MVGKVSGLNTMPVQDLLVVKTPDGKEILIPFVEQIVPEVNVAEGYVLVTPPAGLFEINAEDAGAAEAGEPDAGEPEPGAKA